MATSPALIKQAIEAHPFEAEAALAAIQPGVPVPVTVESLKLAATAQKTTLADIWVAQLTSTKMLETFANALRGKNIPVGDPPPSPVTDVDPDKLARFALQAKIRRSRIYVDQQLKGTGHLVGPSLVLTAWHVVAVNAPGQEQPPRTIEVRLDDGTILPATLPLKLESFCTDDEFKAIGPTEDAQVAADRSDAAVLALAQPVAIHVGYARLPEQPPTGVTQTSVFVAHYPKGKDRGYGTGTMTEIPNLAARWSHNVKTDTGSSGGACFDANLDLWGFHQGHFGGQGRLVPVARFLQQLQTLVQQDVAPDGLWSLNNGIDGALVIGRQAFFAAISAASAQDTAVRGVRIKRTDIKEGDTGLAFSYDILVQLLARRGSAERAVRVPFDGLVPDLGTAIEARLKDAGIVVPATAAEPGVAPGQAALEGTTRDRAERLVRAVNAQAEALGIRVWFFFDNPAVVLTEPTRLFVEAFAAAAMRQPRLRMVIAGFETLSFAGTEFDPTQNVGGVGAPGLLIEYMGTFRDADLLDFLTRATQALKLDPAPPVIDEIVKTALKHLPNQSGSYARSLLPAVAEALRRRLQDLMP